MVVHISDARSNLLNAGDEVAYDSMLDITAVKLARQSTCRVPAVLNCTFFSVEQVFCLSQVLSCVWVFSVDV